MIPCRESAEGSELLVLGIGNVLMSDEGAGVHALRRLSGRIGDCRGVTCIDGGTLGMTLAPDIERCDALIVIDAAQMNRTPGSVAVFEGEDMDLFLGAGRKSSAHEVGLLDLMAAAALVGALPGKRALIGIQAECVGWGTSPSEQVEKGIASACDRAQELIERWR